MYVSMYVYHERIHAYAHVTVMCAGELHCMQEAASDFRSTFFHRLFPLHLAASCTHLLSICWPPQTSLIK